MLKVFIEVLSVPARHSPVTSLAIQSSSVDVFRLLTLCTEVLIPRNSCCLVEGSKQCEIGW